MDTNRTQRGAVAVATLGISPADHARRWWILAACCVVTFAQLAEPHLWILGLEIPASAFGTAWQDYRFVSNLGLILFIAFQLIGGVMGDLLGRRRILLIGAIGSVVCNVLTLAAWNLPSLLVFRALVGVFGGLAFPLALGMTRLFFLGDERKIALLIYNFVVGAGTLAALLGIPIEYYFSWRWALALPIIAGVIGIRMSWQYLPETSATGGVGRVEAVAAAAWAFVTLAVMFGLVVARVSDEWLNPLTIASGVSAILGLLVIVFWSRRTSQPGLLQTAGNVPRHVLSIMLLVSATFSFALSGYVLQMYQFFLTVQQNGGFMAGLALSPIILGTIPFLRWAGRFAIEKPRHLVVGSGLAMMGTAMLMSTLLRPNFPYLLTIPIMSLFGVGLLVASASWAYFFFSVLPADLAGLSAGINRATGMVGGALAGVLLSSIVEFTGMFNFQLRLADLGLDDQQQQLAIEALEAFLRSPLTPEQLADMPGSFASLAVLSAYRESYSVAITSALLTAGLVCLAVGALAWFWLRRIAEEGTLVIADESLAAQPALEQP